MLRLIFTVLVIAIVGFAFGSGRSAPEVHQPSVTAAGYGTGVVGERLAVWPLPAVPGQELMLRRVTIKPGGYLAAHSHPGSLVIYTDAGSWAYTHLAGSAWLTRGDVSTLMSTVPAPLIANSALNPASSKSASSTEEAMSIGSEITLSTGDTLVAVEPGGVFANDAAEPAVLLIAGMTPVGEPFVTDRSDLDNIDR